LHPDHFIMRKKKKKICIVIANYYPDISNKLLSGAIKEFNKNFKFKVVKKIYTTGVFEIPVIISRNIKSFDGFVALGCVIKGKTPHFEFISSATNNAIMNLSINSKKPIGNGIITCLNKKQAIGRSSLSKKNKGKEAAKAVLSILR